jgi:hypothetical protein
MLDCKVMLIFLFSSASLFTTMFYSVSFTLNVVSVASDAVFNATAAAPLCAKSICEHSRNFHVHMQLISVFVPINVYMWVGLSFENIARISR